MPVDPTILHKYGGLGPGSDPGGPSKRRAWPAIVTWAVGTSVIVVTFLFGRGSPAVMEFLLAAGGALAILLLIRALYDGWQDDGIFGIFWRWEEPLGSTLAGDPPPSGVTLVLWWLACIAIVLGLVGWWR